MESKLVRWILIRVSIFVLIWCSFLLILSKESEADTYASAMLGIFNSAKQTYTETKAFNVGYRSDLAFGLTQQAEIGAWFDSAGQGRSSSGYAAYQVGVQAGDVVVLRIMTGPAVITSPDVYLGGPFPQFTEDFAISILGKDGNMVGVKYKHVSSAGIFQPNMGRDFFGVEASIPW